LRENSLYVVTGHFPHHEGIQPTALFNSRARTLTIGTVCFETSFSFNILLHSTSWWILQRKLWSFSFNFPTSFLELLTAGKLSLTRHRRTHTCQDSNSVYRKCLRQKYHHELEVLQHMLKTVYEVFLIYISNHWQSEWGVQALRSNSYWD
jgi:hypothetical protein